jgi:hypothetical protein
MLLAFAASVAPAAASAPPDEAAEGRLVALHNRARSSRGIRPLSVTADLVVVARRHSLRMAEAADGTVWHNENLPNEVRGARELGENVGAGSSVEDIDSSFMSSSEHRDEILHAPYNEIGVGVAVRDRTLYVTEVFVRRGPAPSPPRAELVREVARPRDAAAPARVVVAAGVPATLRRVEAEPGVAVPSRGPALAALVSRARVALAEHVPPARIPDPAPLALSTTTEG